LRRGVSARGRPSLTRALVAGGAADGEAIGVLGAFTQGALEADADSIGRRTGFVVGACRGLGAFPARERAE